MRTDITFLSGGVWCAGWLYRPDGAASTHVPCVVMAHGFSATRELRLDAYAERFCAAGLGVLLFDYRHFGASGGSPRQLVDIRRQHDDFRAAVAHARGLDWVDPDRVALFGSSFSGGHVIAVGASDPRIAATVSQCPFTDGLATLRVLGPAAIARITGPGLLDTVAALRGGPPRYIPAAGPPGSTAVMTTPDALPGMQALMPAETTWENRVAARIVLRVGIYRPGLKAAQLRNPALFCVCDGDSLAPAERTVTLAQRASKAEIKRYPIGHFDIYVGEPFEHAVADQTEFLVRHLAP
ncbi:MAG TPA: alpha/beta fold hydrolase [Solirubrobacteraceae bacterium]|nr:alpha/beta fold hydrolase [Solirubrobacteraceae bacterium]